MRRKAMENKNICHAKEAMENKNICLVSSDGQEFDVKMIAVFRSLTIMKKLQLRPKSDNSPVVLDEIDGKTLEKVIKYCIRHYEADSRSLDQFDAEFVNVDETTFFNLIGAAYYLKIQSLMDLTCGALSKKFKGKKNYMEMSEVIANWKQNAE